MNIGQKVKAIREGIGLKRDEFAAKTGIPIGTLIGIEQGRHEPKVGILIAITKYWPEYAAYLLIEDVKVVQKLPTINP